MRLKIKPENPEPNPFPLIKHIEKVFFGGAEGSRTLYLLGANEAL